MDWTLHEGIPLLDVAPDFKTIRVQRQDDVKLESSAHGPATPWMEELVERRVFRLPFLLPSHETASRFRAFVAGRRGSQLPFWVPLYTNDYPARADYAAAAPEIRVDHVRLAERWSRGERFQHLAVVAPGKI